jgi:Nitronate monooxygenase
MTRDRKAKTLVEGRSLEVMRWSCDKLACIWVTRWSNTVLKTALCDVLGIDVPIILAPMAVFASPAEMAASVSNCGGLGSLATLFRATAAIKRDIDEVRELTNRNYAVNHIPPTLDLITPISPLKNEPPRSIGRAQALFARRRGRDARRFCRDRNGD